MQALSRLIFSLLLLAAFLGIFVISQLTGLVQTALQFSLSSSGFLIFLNSFLIAIILFFFLRKKLSALTESSLSRKMSHNGGAIIGLIRGTIVIAIVTIILINLPFGLFKETIENSILASQVKYLVAVDEPQTVSEQKSPEESDKLIIGY